MRCDSVNVNGNKILKCAQNTPFTSSQC